MLKEELDLHHVSTGDILRGEVRSGTTLGKKAEQQMTNGGSSFNLLYQLLNWCCNRARR